MTGTAKACCPEVAIARRELQHARQEERAAVQMLRHLQLAGAPPADLRYAAERLDRVARARARCEHVLRRELAACGAVVQR